MLSRLIAEQALAAALRTGGDFAEIFYEDTRSGSLTLNAGAVETALTGRSAGAAGGQPSSRSAASGSARLAPAAVHA